MVVRKVLTKPKKETQEYLGPKSLTISRSAKIDDLPDAIVDDKFVCQEGDRLILRKDYLDDVTMSHCTVMKIHEEKGLAELYDETKQQWIAVEIVDSERFTLKMRKTT